MHYGSIENFIRIVAVFLLWSQYLSGINDSTGKFRLNINAGLIFSRNFSNYPLRSDADDVSSTEYSPSPGAAKYRTGFLIGADALLFSKENFKLVFGISLSRTSAAYHSSYISEGPTSKPGFTKLTRATENDYQLKYTALNFHAGIRNHLFSNFFLTTGLLLNSPLKITRILNGSTVTKYSNVSGGTESDVIYIRNEQTTLKQKAANISFRLNFEYQFTLSSSLARVFLFKNFGLLYALPWWGIGVSYTVR